MHTCSAKADFIGPVVFGVFVCGNDANSVLVGKCHAVVSQGKEIDYASVLLQAVEDLARRVWPGVSGTIVGAWRDMLRSKGEVLFAAADVLVVDRVCENGVAANVCDVQAAHVGAQINTVRAIAKATEVAMQSTGGFVFCVLVHEFELLHQVTNAAVGSYSESLACWTTTRVYIGFGGADIARSGAHGFGVDGSYRQATRLNFVSSD
jgi:hypothetical protein